MHKKISSILSLVLILALLLTSVVYASEVDVTSVVDVTAPTGSVELAPGGSGAITISMKVTGKQEGTATFEVYRIWTLSGGTFVGSDPVEFSVDNREAQDAADTFSTEGTVTVATGHAAGTYTLNVGVFDITNSNTTGAKLKAGDSATYSVTVIVASDTTPPVITWHDGPEDGGEYYFGFVPATATCTALDDVDGEVDCEVSEWGDTVGQHTMIATASDSSGNVATETRTYTVLAWTLYGFYQPVDMGGVWNTVKSGSTVPLKFEVFAGPTELTSTEYIFGFSVIPVACEVSAPSEAIEMITTGGTVLRYDTAEGQFIQNWQTPKGKAGSCYTVTMTTLDGSSISANFKLK